MSKTKQWKLDIKGIEYDITFIPNQWSGNHKLLINGNAVELKKAPFQAFVGLDQLIQIGGTDCHFVAIGNKADIAVDGVYIGSKKQYIPLKGMPWWTWIFIAVCIAIPVVSLGGALPVVFALLGTIGCARVSTSPTIKVPMKLLLCFGVTALAWMLFGLLMFLV